jgi:hypothetical protein
VSTLTRQEAATRFYPQAHQEEEHGRRWLFIGWGAPVRGREAKGLEVFNEALAYSGRLQQEGVIEGFETAILEPHGGELQGLVLIRGSQEKLAQFASMTSSCVCRPAQV